jgi:hypothetical protein
MPLAAVHPVPPAPAPHASLAVWVVVAIVLAIVVASGVVLTSRR